MPENKPTVVPQKAFDLKALEGKLLEKGLPHLEGAARAIVESVFEWTEESITASETKIDDFAMLLLPAVKKYVLSKVDEIAADLGAEHSPEESKPV